MKILYTSLNSYRDSLPIFIAEEKEKNPEFTVVDIGGGDSSYLGVDTIADLRPREGGVKLDICDTYSWEAFEKHNRGNLFDFAICTHTLEDVRDPFIALKWLPRIAKSGLIATPSLWHELKQVENSNWLGYYHHRWIFTEENGVLNVVPKLGMLEWMVKGMLCQRELGQEIQVFWDNEIPHKPFMEDDYLGPTKVHALVNYRNLLFRHNFI